MVVVEPPQAPQIREKIELHLPMLVVVGAVEHRLPLGQVEQDLVVLVMVVLVVLVADLLQAEAVEVRLAMVLMEVIVVEMVVLVDLSVHLLMA